MKRANLLKPVYSVPSMGEIAAIAWNGYNVVSTFSGCGGSCLGYRMAGFRVLWANEFVPIAQESYRANMRPGSILDGRDIHQVQAAEILAAIGLNRGEIDVFDGSPPCQAFSTAGQKEAGWGKDKVYEHGAAQKNETLFDEYTRLLRDLQPKTFIAENVSGLIKGTSKGFFLDILAALKACGYRVKAKVLDAQWLGVPQMRQRVIFVGVRNDLAAEPMHPGPLKYRFTVRDALPWISSLRLHGDTWGSGLTHVSPTIGASDAGRKLTAQFSAGGWVASSSHPTERRKLTIPELKRICAFPDDFELKGTYSQQWERLGNSVPPLMMRAIAATLRDKVLMKL